MKIKMFMLGCLLGTIQQVSAFRITSGTPGKIFFEVEGKHPDDLESLGSSRTYTNLKYQKLVRRGQSRDNTVYESSYIRFHLGDGTEYYIDLLQYPEKIRNSEQDLLFFIESENRVKVLAKLSETETKEEILTPGKGLYTKAQFEELRLKQASAAAAEGKKEGEKVDYAAELAQLRKREVELKAELERVTARIRVITDTLTRTPQKAVI